MQINYLDAVSSVLNMMKQPDSACKNIDMHRTCYTTFFKYLMDNDIPFSMDAALDWLEIKKLEISYEACSQYRNALFRLEHYLLFGDTSGCDTKSLNLTVWRQCRPNHPFRWMKPISPALPVMALFGSGYKRNPTWNPNREGRMKLRAAMRLGCRLSDSMVN